MKFNFVFVIVMLVVVGCSNSGNKITKPDVISPPTKQLEDAGSGGKEAAKMVP